MAKKSEMIGFKATPELKKSLEKLAEKEDRTVSYIINRILEAYIKEIAAHKGEGGDLD